MFDFFGGQLFHKAALSGCMQAIYICLGSEIFIIAVDVPGQPSKYFCRNTVTPFRLLFLTLEKSHKSWKEQIFSDEDILENVDLKNFTKFTQKKLLWSHFLIKSKTVILLKKNSITVIFQLLLQDFSE